MVNTRGVRWFGAAVIAACIAAGGFGSAVLPHRASAQSGDALVRVQPQKESVKKGDPLAVDVTIENVKNEASIQFDLLYNPTIFETANAGDDPNAGFVQKGEFLGSTGRQVICNPVSNEGVVRFTCVTLGLDPAGPDGGGKVATVFLKAIGSGKTELTLGRVTANAVGLDATEIPLQLQNATIIVTGGGGFNWLLWIPIIVVGALVVAGLIAFGAMRMRSGTNRPAAMR